MHKVTIYHNLSQNAPIHWWILGGTFSATYSVLLGTQSLWATLLRTHYRIKKTTVCMFFFWVGLEVSNTNRKIKTKNQGKSRIHVNPIRASVAPVRPALYVFSFYYLYRRGKNSFHLNKVYTNMVILSLF